MQALETSSPPEEVIEALLIEIKKNRITSIHEITHQRIKDFLKKLGYTKMYEHIPAIIYKLCGIPPPKISKKLEKELITMFEEIQIPFAKHCPKDRKNFMSYGYTLHKMCQLLGEDELLKCFPLLKSREKLYVQDKIWEGICSDLKWQYIRSI